MLRCFTYFVIPFFLICSFPCNAESISIDYKTSADDHAPIFVMEDHNHKAGEWMFSLRHAHMAMNDNFEKTKKIPIEEIFKSNYIMVPKDMTVSIYMGGIMYGINDKLTLLFMTPFIAKKMSMITLSENKENTHSTAHQIENTNHHHTAGKDHISEHNMESMGFGDIKLSGLFTLYESPTDLDSFRPLHKWLLQSGLSFPTGSITKGEKTRHPYPMQLGSGTIDPILSMVYILKKSRWSFGIQSSSIFRIMNNKSQYRLGNEYKITTWLACNLLQQLSISYRMEYKHWGNIKGKDKDLKNISPTSREDLRAGKSINAAIGINIYQNQKPLLGNRLGLEFAMPLYQNLKGPQMGLNHYIVLGWQLAF